MPIMLAERDPDAREIMDEPDCDLDQLYNTYRQFRFVNVISRPRWIYRKWLKPVMVTQPDASYSLLDIGFGGGDISLQIANWANQDGLKLKVTGIEIDGRACDYVRTLNSPENASFRLIDIHDLVERGEQFDFVISNHMVHHLNYEQFTDMLECATRACKRFVLFIDLKRSDIAYVLFGAATYPFFRNSYIHHDGLSSLRRSYTFSELKELAPPGWQVTPLFPFRLVLSRRVA
ncbi:MAG TPA: methyltransferase domain-containing protein [Gammaproteobacteria bacterium]|nr:methyltransferase domain-containing protein [Gammaproteobacteria bacterium]HKH20311.1 methyltransferase domain-containing protein [Gammaproteobacteria bacterium]